ncbi:MAG: hypothetical protein IJD79_03310 [Clostridia bacterium]|nr:hypothetical protein [Clostridia bacterium]
MNFFLPEILLGFAWCFFVIDPKRCYAPFDPRYARISTTLRMTDDEKFWLRAVRLNMSKINLSFQIENL